MRSLVRDAVPDYVRQAYDEVEKRQRINGEIENGEFVRVVELRKANGIKYVGKVGEILKTEKKSKPFLDAIDDLNFQSVLVEKVVGDAVKKARMLTQKREVLKTEKKPDANEIVLVALEGKSGEVLRRLVDASSRR
jgi:hypothetical protein